MNHTNPTTSNVTDLEFLDAAEFAAVSAATVKAAQALADAAVAVGDLHEILGSEATRLLFVETNSAANIAMMTASDVRVETLIRSRRS